MWMFIICLIILLIITLIIAGKNIRSNISFHNNIYKNAFINYEVKKILNNNSWNDAADFLTEKYGFQKDEALNRINELSGDNKILEPAGN